jgi:host factor-I protein
MTSSKKQENLQDVFLNHLRTTKTRVTLYLINGVRLEGIITGFDTFSVLLKRDKSCQLVYKHAISTVMPFAPIRLFNEEEEDEDTQQKQWGEI